MARSKEFVAWQKLECARRLGQLSLIDEEVEKQMRAENIKIEYL